MFGSRWAVSMLLLAVAAGGAVAAPVPITGGLAYVGTPSFNQGTWLSGDHYEVLMSVPGQGGVTQVLLLNSSINTVMTTFESFECITSSEYRAGRGRRQSTTASGWQGVARHALVVSCIRLPPEIRLQTRSGRGAPRSPSRQALPTPGAAFSSSTPHTSCSAPPAQCWAPLAYAPTPAACCPHPPGHSSPE